MVLAGFVLAVVQIETPAALTATAYGRVFLAKMVAVALLLTFAGLNRQRLTSALTTPTGSRNLIRSIAAETMLAIAILGLVATWRFTPPPRALAAAAAEPISIHFHTAPAMVQLTLTPGHVGPVTASMVIMTGDFGPLDPKEVTLTLANPAAGIEPIERRAERAADGSWRVENLVVPLAGHWRVSVNTLISNFDKATVEGDVNVRPWCLV
jgi:copper transport protein